jgi:hypothetical protein
VHSRKAILAFCRLAHRTVRCTTGHCPVHHRTLSGADFFPSLAKPTIGALEPLAHRTLSDAHRTVRCPLPTVGSATCLARIARPTVGPANRWLTGQSGAHRTVRCTPDSPVHTRQSGAHPTVRCTPDSPVNYSHTPLITSREQQVRLSQPGAPDTVRCTQTELTLAEQSHL